MSEDREKDPCIYTYEAFQPNLSSIKEKVALITVNRCEQKKQARNRKKRKKSKKNKQNKDSKRVLKSLKSRESKGKKHQTFQRKRKKKKKKKRKRKKKRSRLKDRRGKVHREFKDWKRFVGTGMESIKEKFGKREDKLLASLVDGSSKWRKLLKQRKTVDQPQHISHHLG